jgi:hypothetical protein
MSRRRRILAAVTLAAGVGAGACWATRRPSNDRDWTPNEAVLPAAEFDGARVHLRNVRHTAYRTADAYVAAYEDRTVDLDRLERAWFAVVPFAGQPAVAHTFLSFEFAGDSGPSFVAISVEARKERGETYHFVKGLFRRYELMYVVADERDVIGLRAVHRGEAVYLYPMRAPRERVRALFVAMLERANALRRRPEFYNTLTANCTSTIVGHVNSLVPGRVPFTYRRLLPGLADRLAYDLGLIETELPFDAVRARFLITPRAQRAGNDPAFSVRIRDGVGEVP